MEFPGSSAPATGAGEQILTVTELTRHIKRLLEGQVGACWVRGEMKRNPTRVNKASSYPRQPRGESWEMS